MVLYSTIRKLSSRGAAVANLLAAELTRPSQPDAKRLATKDNIYAYTFATPNVFISGNGKDVKAGYENIYNYVNSEDFVTQVPLYDWGYAKYGVTKEFTSTDEKSSFAKAYISTGRLGFAVDPKECDEGIKAFKDAAPTTSIYYKGIYDKLADSPPLFNLCYGVIAPAAINGDLNLVLAAMYGYDKILVLSFFKANQNTTIFYAHTPETYYAYISSTK